MLIDVRRCCLLLQLQVGTKSYGSDFLSEKMSASHKSCLSYVSQIVIQVSRMSADVRSWRAECKIDRDSSKIYARLMVHLPVAGRAVSKVSDGNPRNIKGVFLYERISFVIGPIVLKFGLRAGPTLLCALATVDHQKSIFSI